MDTIITEYFVSSNARQIDAAKYKKALDVVTRDFLTKNTNADSYVTAIEKNGKTVVASNPTHIKRKPVIVEKKVTDRTSKCKCTCKKCVRKERCTCKKGIVNCSCGYHWNNPKHKGHKEVDCNSKR